MSSNPDRNPPQSLDDLAPYVADVIEHAMTLQNTAAVAVGRVDAAAKVVTETAKTLVSNHAQMAAQIEQRVAEKFDAAMNGAGMRIGEQLTAAEQQSQKALGALTTATRTATDAIKGEADRLKESRWLPMLISGGFGALVGAAISGTAVYLVLTRVTG